MTFDNHGHITPYQIIEISLKEFEFFFVSSREEKNHRNKLFSAYLEYLAAIEKIVGPNFFQLINGSFTTLKLKPNDLDFVTFVDYQILSNCENAINLLSESGKEKYDLDGFFAPHSLPGHPYFINSQLLFEYWKNLFSFTRMNHEGNHLPKGLIKITFPQ